MTIDEVCVKYQIPKEILKLYESWGLCGEVKKVMQDWKYDDTDIERLSLIMTLHDIGFDSQETEQYMRLFTQDSDTVEQRMKMIQQKRNHTLDEIHMKEKQLERMDYLRYMMDKEKNS